MSTMSQIGYSGVNAAQVAMQAVSHNLANLKTPGFSRLTTLMGSLAGGSGQRLGGGVEVLGMRRMTDSFFNQQLWRAGSQAHFHDSGQKYLAALEVNMGGEGTRISSGLDQLFAALSAASSTPDAIALRQQILIESRNLAQRFNGLGGNLANQLAALHEQRTHLVTELNGLTENLAGINQEIVEVQAAGADTSALRDHRDSLVSELSDKAMIRTREQPDGSLDISLVNGQPLVAGRTAGQLLATQTAGGGQQLELSFAGSRFPLPQDGFGAALGGLYQVEHETLIPISAALQEMAGEVARLFNDTLATGFDLNGQPGQALFSFNPNSSHTMLEITALTPEQLAFAAQPGEPGNADVLRALLALKGQTISVGANQVTLNDAYTGLLGQVASTSRQNQADLTTAAVVAAQAQAQRDSVSAVNENEEAVNLMSYLQAYEANMKVIQTANQLFDSLLATA